MPAGDESGGAGTSKVEEPQKQPKPTTADNEGGGKCPQRKTSIEEIMRALFKQGGKKHEEKQALEVKQAEKKLEIKRKWIF